MKKVDHDLRRAEVAEAAAKLIAREGLTGLTTRALAKSMGCSIGVLSHYFNSKEQIVQAAFDWADTRLDTRMEDVMGQNPTLDSFLPVIREGLPLDETRDVEWRVRFHLYNHMLTSGDLVGQREKLQNYRILLFELLKELKANGGIRQDIDPALIANTAFDLVIGTAQNLLMLPMEERELHAASIFTIVENLRPEAELQAKSKPAA